MLTNAPCYRRTGPGAHNFSRFPEDEELGNVSWYYGFTIDPDVKSAGGPGTAEGSLPALPTGHVLQLWQPLVPDAALRDGPPITNLTEAISERRRAIAGGRSSACRRLLTAPVYASCLLAAGGDHSLSASAFVTR